MSSDRFGNSPTAAYSVTSVSAPEISGFPLSFSQERLWFLDQLSPGLGIYNIPTALRLHGTLDLPALSASLREIVMRHQALRTHFAQVNSQPIQIIDPGTDWSMTVEDRTATYPTARELQMMAEAEAQRPFDLSRGPLMRAHLLKLSAQEHVLFLTLHHIVSDGWSMGVLVREAVMLYMAYAAGRPSPLPSLPLQYTDYAVRQRERLAGEALDTLLTYWRKTLAGVEPLELPTDYPRPPVQRYQGATYSFSTSAAAVGKVRRMCADAGVTPFIVLLAAWQAVLSRYSGQDDIVVGTPIAGRDSTELEGLIGFFINTLALRVDTSGDPSFRELIARVRKTCLGAYDHQGMPFEKIVEDLQPHRDLSRQPLLQVMFLIDLSQKQETVSTAALRLEPVKNENKKSVFDLSLAMSFQPQEIRGNLEYDTDLFRPETVSRLAQHYVRLLEGVLAAPDVPLSQVSMLSPAERRQLLVEWNATAHTFSEQPETLHGLFEAQAQRTPEAVAVWYAGQTWTYAELDAHATRLAQALARVGVGRGARVGICLDRSLEMMAALLGTLKAGAAYVPLDPHYPLERLRWILTDSRPSALLSSPDLMNKQGIGSILREAEFPLLYPSALPETEVLTTEELVRVSNEDLAYIIYTSGSTGQPKGVEIEHRSIVNRLLWMQKALALEPGEGVIQKTPLTFDVSLWELFWPLAVGGRLILARPGGQGDPRHLLELIEETQATTMHFVPPMLGAFVEALSPAQAVVSQATLTRVVCSGEALPGELVGRFYTRLGAKARLYNLYGPTEAAVDVTWWDCHPEDGNANPPIGWPIANMQTYVLDRKGQPVPVGVPGELYLGGIGLARGYINRPALTAERFVPDPFASESGRRLYKTGDRCRWRADASLEYLGRLDDQVKIRGFRIELGEIESVLDQHPQVAQAVVVAMDAGGNDRRLVAYVVSKDVYGLEITELDRFVRDQLPEYMVPSAWVSLEAFPLTPNGKVDRRSLPEPEMNREQLGEYVPPRTTVEMQLTEIWREVLDIERVGVYDNFFQLGGHSLLAMQIVTRIRDHFEIELPVRTLFDKPTVAGTTQALTVLMAEQQDVEEVAQMIEELTHLSSEELKAMLAEE